MLETGLEGTTLAGLTALLGLAQAFLLQNQRGIRERIFNLWTLYFTRHLIVAIILFCLWKIPSSVAYHDIAFLLLLENAWIEALSITLCSCLRIAVDEETLYDMSRCVAAITYVLHVSGFLLLVIGQDNAKPMLFGASLLVPSFLPVFSICIRSSGNKISLRLHRSWIYCPSSVVGLAVLAAIRDDDEFFQANVIFATVTSLVLACLPFFRSSKISNGLCLCYARPDTFIWFCKGTCERQIGNLAQQHDGSAQAFHLGEKQGYSEEQSDFRSGLTELTYTSGASSPPSPLIPPAAIHSPSYRIGKEPSTIKNPANKTSFDGAPIVPNYNGILVTTEVETHYSDRQDVDQLTSSSWIFSDERGC